MQWILRSHHVLLLLILLPGLAFATSGQESNTIQWEEIEYLQSEANDTSVRAAQKILQAPMQNLSKPQINFGYYRGTVWLRFRIQTDLPAQARLRLHLDSSFLENVQLFAAAADQMDVRGHSGLRYPLSERALPTRFPAFEFTADEARRHTWLLAIQSSYPLATAVTVQSLDSYHAFDRSMQIIVGFFAGAFLVMAFYNLFLYFSLRDRSYLVYALTIILTHGAVILGNFGVVNEYFWPENPWLMKHHYIICESLALVCNAQLARLFFDTAKQAPRFNSLVWVFIWTGIILTFITIFSFPAWLPMVANLALGLGIVTIMALGAYFACKGMRAARLFLVSWLPLLVGGIVVIAALLFSWEITKIFKYVVLVGALFECVLLSMALGFRYRVLLLQNKMIEMENRYMVTEMESAKEIQDALMPQSFQVPGMNFFHYYRSADRTGGDIYGYYHNKTSDLVFVFIGDVTGHGLSSALVTSNISGSIYASLRNQNPEQFASLEDYMTTIVLNVNNELIRVCRSQKLSTFLMVAFDLKKGEVVQLNAGHLPVLHYSQGAVKTHVAMGSPLGLVNTPKVGCKRFSIKEQDMLLLVTDGVVEQKDLSLRKLVHLMEHSPEADAIHQQLQQKVEANTKPEDDITWLLIQWKGLGP